MQLERKSFGWSTPGGRPRTIAVLAGTVLVLFLACGAAELPRVAPDASSSATLDSDHLYNLTNVWTIHLEFRSDQWAAMEPKGGGNPFGGGRGGGRGGGLNAARMLSPVFMSLGDLNRDGRIARDEFSSLAQNWFKAWDVQGKGTLDESQIRAGLEKIRSPAGGMSLMLQGPEGKRNGLSSAFGIEFEYVHADLEFEGRLLKDVGVRYKG